MKIRITDIPPQGRVDDYDVDAEQLNSRAAADIKALPKESVSPPRYVFSGDPKATLELRRQGTTIFMNGNCKTSFSTSCSRCGDETTQQLDVPISMVLKPAREAAKSEEVEDIQLGYYVDEEINCSSFVEEAIMLALPFAVLCSQDCQGLTSEGSSVAYRDGKWTTEVEPTMDDRLAALTNIKIH